jgi:hypothetical protein
MIRGTIHPLLRRWREGNSWKYLAIILGQELVYGNINLNMRKGRS